MKSFIYFLIVPLFLFANNFEKSENIIIDHTNNIMWQDNLESTQYIEDITMGKTYCDDLILNGYIDWKMATIKQLESIVNVTNKNIAINKKFEYTTSSPYWSQTSYLKSKNKFWFIDFKTGIVNFDSRNKEFTIRCVRDMK